MTGKLILVRHGQTFANVEKRLDTLPPGAALTDLGHEQAKRFGDTLVATPPSVLVSSVALRARQTAEHIAKATSVPAQERDGIQETFVGEWEDRTDKEAHDAFTAIYGKWQAGDLDAQAPGGDSGRSILDRYVPVLESLRDEHLTDLDAPDVVVVSHGAAIRLVGAVLGGVDGEFAADNHLNNTETVELVPTPGGGWTCVRWGTFLPPFAGKGSHVADNPIS
ncbi:histidine phosphatase family protein [Rhodococcus sp. BP-252]|uniref:histidine phosphatase family protein n=1 Tax=unclassified Rhodococcus (in: high G+C Gram-positive bacteria) TaxID=192944 RepID=UPI001C9ADBB2|nr:MULTISPECIES: histidine phosphatase family protein [unclassified Rhodococcus (in: high G+C Gram-positive bacteria)]MBY6411782.1 histidine phosphatase family protein [Rhodococcus sp. BP-320]MBY6419806.1 histidine phosphatase family protein [Rhodococcus sp. BP-321]MBY6424779.1 histidine phosphatase family protein [Rhodococcus sp. BP-324]MBY6429748.1 histidine phosphatase family protein [Rhodococcus sp. BP-323]MBY6434715.1 histidine phosphatase family protein [Rhodococcus sp. BP-322]